MIKYFAKRVLYVIPTIIGICLLAFTLTELVPGDVTDIKISNEDMSAAGVSLVQIQETQDNLRGKFKLNKPLFYFSLQSLALPEQIHDLKSPSKKNAIKNWANIYGCKSEVWDFYIELEKTEKTNLIQQIYFAHQQQELEELISSVSAGNDMSTLKKAFVQLKKAQNHIAPLIPVIHFHGSNNRFHSYLKNIFNGSLGISYKDFKPVSNKISKAFIITLSYTFPAFLLIWLISVPLGIFLSSNHTSFNSFIKGALYLLDATPLFWLSLLLLLTFSSGIIFNIFPVYGLGRIEENDLLFSVLEKIHHLTLPVISLVLAGIPYVTRQVEKNMTTVNKNKFIQTAYAKGLQKRSIIWKHAFSNTKIPLLTIFWAHIPALFGGALIVEIVFTLPGIGMLLIESVHARDYPVIIGIIIISASVKVMSMILSDLTYFLSDPRIKYAS